MTPPDRPAPDMPAADRPAAELSRPVSTTRLGADTMVYRLVTSAAERAALARRFDLVALESLAATVRLTRQGRDISLAAELTADVVQLCGVTLEPFASQVTDQATVLYRRCRRGRGLRAADRRYDRYRRGGGAAAFPRFAALSARPRGGDPANRGAQGAGGRDPGFRAVDGG